MIPPREQGKIIYYAAVDALREQRERGREVLRSRGLSPKAFRSELQTVVNVPEWYKVNWYGIYLTYCEQVDLNPTMTISQFAVFRFGGLTFFQDGKRMSWLEAGLVKSI